MSPNYPACYMLLRRDNKLLFVMRENTGYMDGQFSLPAGRVEENEPFSLGAIREALEEVGVKVELSNIKHVYTQHRFSETSNKKQWVDVFFEANGWAGDPLNNAPDEHSGVAWLEIDALPDNIMDYQKHALELIAKGETYGEFGWPV